MAWSWPLSPMAAMASLMQLVSGLSTYKKWARLTKRTENGLNAGVR